jgi:hypothetical protein
MNSDVLNKLYNLFFMGAFLRSAGTNPLKTLIGLTVEPPSETVKAGSTISENTGIPYAL